MYYESKQFALFKRYCQKSNNFNKKILMLLQLSTREQPFLLQVKYNTIVRKIHLYLWNWNLDKNIIQLEICIRKIFSIIWRKYVNMVTTRKFKINKMLKICMQIYNFAWRLVQCTIAYPHRCQSPRLNHMHFTSLLHQAAYIFCYTNIYLFII